jgi:hypothetical protein
MLPPEGLLTGDPLHEPDDCGRNFRAKFECNRGTGTGQTAQRVGGGPDSENPCLSGQIFRVVNIVATRCRPAEGDCFMLARSGIRA